ncbi:enolase C-terminal domain-like protein [Dactylosporangium matsuzakiense]|uniref:Mandelate racemase n=1 Tax=Dactylosporangium matsuzakiense TaxID=53360 RepID=A0A9W6KEL1_9ACTN|nr:enolase C-terminal domain-like protein [Dactylosporangium matsuzakiense]UWZ42220.1 mandelate racemase [Dactylosporangium matsuzakiense]GLK99867.1 mandelate racemase [Dactylosporangium matsuzakiense]
MVATAIVDDIRLHAFTVPTDGPDGVEQDGTATWSSTTMVLVEARANGVTGLGYTYGAAAAAAFAESELAPVVVGMDALAPPAAAAAMGAAMRNAGRPGVGAMALSALDVALWDLRARLLDVPLFKSLPSSHDHVPVYGSGGFTNYSVDRLTHQLAAWVEAGIGRVKLKISRQPEADPARLRAVREAIGSDPQLFADANGALPVKVALDWAYRLRDEWGVSWFEEPVSSADLGGLRLLREQGPPGLEVAAGEYGFVLRDFTNLLSPPAVDCLQADVTRCGGITGLLAVAGLAAGHGVDVSAHCAPAVSAHAFCAVPGRRHAEYFHDHVRVEQLLFDGVLEPEHGALWPDPDRTGLGLAVRWAEAERFRVYGPADRSGR